MATATALEHLTTRLVGFLLSQASDDFGEAVEIQCAVPGYPLLIGAAFPLSLIARALDRAAPHDAEVQAVVARLAETLLQFGDADGWRYFTLCPDIPPDADDLAQVMALLVERRHPDRAALLAGPLRRLALNAVGPGRFRTWLTATAAEAAGADATWAAGHDPVHPEVVANLLHALLLFDAEAFRDDIVAGAAWLATRKEHGRWSSYWYFGHGYGTHLALRLLAAVGRRWHDALPVLADVQDAARKALLSSQRADGSWEVERPPLGLVELGGAWEPESGRALETALCLAALSELPIDDALGAARERAIGYLAGIQEADGGFAAEPYYFTMGLMPHRSRALTAAAVLSAVTFAGQEGG